MLLGTSDLERSRPCEQFRWVVGMRGRCRGESQHVVVAEDQIELGVEKLLLRQDLPGLSEGIQGFPSRTSRRRCGEVRLAHLRPRQAKLVLPTRELSEGT